MDIAAIKALIKAMAGSDLEEMEVSENGWTLRLSRHGRSVVTPVIRPADLPTAPLPPPLDTPVAAELQAPLAGIVHLARAPDEAPFVTIGEVVAAGDTVCLIEAMKMFNAVTAERTGIVEAVLVTSGSDVEAGQPLMRIA